MDVREYLGLVLKSLNPNRHRDLVKLPFFDLVKYFFFVVGLGLLASVIVLLPVVAQYQGSLQDELSGFDEFRVDLNVSLNESVTVLERPLVVVDFERDELDDEFVLVNNESFMFKKFLFFGEEVRDFSDYESVKGERSVSLFSKLVIFALPSVLFWISVFFVLKAVLLAGLFSVLGWLLFMSSKNEISFQKSVKASIFAATPMLLLELALWPVFLMLFIPVFVYVVYFVIALVMVSDRKYKG